MAVTTTRFANSYAIGRELDLERFELTVVRVTNEDVFGDRERLLEKLRDGWQRALRRKSSRK